MDGTWLGNGWGVSNHFGANPAPQTPGTGRSKGTSALQAPRNMENQSTNQANQPHQAGHLSKPQVLSKSQH